METIDDDREESNELEPDEPTPPINLDDLTDGEISFGERVYGSYAEYARRLDSGDPGAQRLARTLNMCLVTENGMEFETDVSAVLSALARLEKHDLGMIDLKFQDQVGALREMAQDWKGDDSLIGLITASIAAEYRFRDKRLTAKSLDVFEASQDAYAASILKLLGGRKQAAKKEAA
jgi:hypothetical protein